MPTPWHPIDLARPCYSLRCAARGMAPEHDPRRCAALGIERGGLAPVLTLPEAAALLGLGVPAVHGPEMRELDGGSISIANFLRRADRWMLDAEIRVRRRA